MSGPFERHYPGDVSVSDDRARMDMELVFGFISTSYWAAGIPRASFERACAGSLLFGLFLGQEQIGFARVVTDRATFAYLCDVFTVEAHQRQGHGKQLIEALLEHPDLQGLRRFMLATRDAHGLYAKYGFTPLRTPDRMMERLDPEVYRRG
jgi:GNAT superfamily N-acetyltransferase